MATKIETDKNGRDLVSKFLTGVFGEPIQKPSTPISKQEFPGVTLQTETLGHVRKASWGRGQDDENFRFTLILDEGVSEKLKKDTLYFATQNPDEIPNFYLQQRVQSYKGGQI